MSCKWRQRETAGIRARSLLPNQSVTRAIYAHKSGDTVDHTLSLSSRVIRPRWPLPSRQHLSFRRWRKTIVIRIWPIQGFQPHLFVSSTTSRVLFTICDPNRYPFSIYETANSSWQHLKVRITSLLGSDAVNCYHVASRMKGNQSRPRWDFCNTQDYEKMPSPCTIPCSSFPELQNSASIFLMACSHA
jgi:hypothetical protein